MTGCDRAWRWHNRGWRRFREMAYDISFTDRGVIVEHGSPDAVFDQASASRTREFFNHLL